MSDNESSLKDEMLANCTKYTLTTKTTINLTNQILKIVKEYEDVRITNNKDLDKASEIIKQFVLLKKELDQTRKEMLDSFESSVAKIKNFWAPYEESLLVREKEWRNVVIAYNQEQERNKREARHKALEEAERKRRLEQQRLETLRLEEEKRIKKFQVEREEEERKAIVAANTREVVEIEARNINEVTERKAYLAEIEVKKKEEEEAIVNVDALIKKEEKARNISGNLKTQQDQVYIKPDYSKVPEIYKTSGLVIREDWKYEIIDENAVPREFCSPDRGKINSAVKKTKGEIEILGVRIFKESGTVSRN